MKCRVLLVGCLMLTLAIAGCVDDELGHSDFTIMLLTPNVEPRESGGQTVWDVTLTVFKVTPKDFNVRWDDITMVVKSSMRSILMQATQPTKDVDLYGTNPEVWYVENASGEDTLDAGDALRITTITTDYERATIEVLADDTRIGSSTLPLDFPSLAITPTVHLAAPDVSRRDDGGVTVWDVILNINKITPYDVEVPWTDIRIVVYDTSGMVILASQPLDEDPGSGYGTSPDVWFIEVMQGDTNMSAGDTVKLTGLDESYEGGKVELRLDGEKIASTTLPTNFP